MKTVAAGYTAVRRSPAALVPLSAQGVAAGLLALLGAFPARGAGASSSAAFPFDLFFDVKHALAFASAWPLFAATIGLFVLVRAGIFSATLWLLEGRPGPWVQAWVRTAFLAGIAAAAFIPPAGLLYAGVAMRYAPFVWIGGILGFFAAVVIVRRAVRIDVGRGAPAKDKAPEFGSVLGYAYVIAVIAAALSAASSIGDWAPALLLACTGPLHALFVAGWRERARTGAPETTGAITVAVTAAVIAGLLVASMYDRHFRRPVTGGTVREEGSVLLLGGVDSTSTTGALTEFDPREIGYARERAEMLSYRGAGVPYRALDTRRDLGETARAVAAQIAGAPRPRVLVGHSQAALVLDRILATGAAPPDLAVDLAPTPPNPPPVRAVVGAGFARALSRALTAVGAPGFDIDAPASPVRLTRVSPEPAIPRLTVWPVGDSVWLSEDWRRPGSLNVVAMTDHVGVVTNARALAEARAFVAGMPVSSDEASWRGALVALFRYVFEPWRPG
jgi:hypothetical protein